MSQLWLDPWQLVYINDHLMCDSAVDKDPFSLQYVSDLFVTQGQVKTWHDDDYCNDDEFIMC